MEDRNQSVEYFEGNWNGDDIRFKRVWSGYRFTDAECEQLLAGNEITCNDFVSQKTGKKFSARGKLALKEYNDKQYVGFDVIEFVHEDRIPDVFLEHKFTKKELEQLYAGEKIHVKGLKSSKGNQFDTDLTWGMRDNGRMGLIFHFEEK